MRGGALACVMGDMDLVRPLGLAGIGCAVVAPPGDPVAFSRFTRVRLDPIDPAERPDELADRLVRFARQQARPPVLFYQQDRDLLFVSRQRRRLAEALRFVVPAPELVEDLVDKARFQGLAERLGLPVPPARLLVARDEPPPADLGLRFPVVVKPLPCRDARWDDLDGAGKALRVEDPPALRRLWPRLRAAADALLAQELVPGPESRVESYHAYLDEEGRTVAEFTGRKLRTHPIVHGHSTALTITRAPDVAALGREVLGRIGLRGVAKVDLKRAPDGRLALLEVNPRFNLWHHLGAAAGLNLPALVHADLSGAGRPASGPARAGATWSYPRGDLAAAREGGVALGAWLRWTLAADANATFAWDDPMPLLRGTLGRRLRGLLSRSAPVPGT